MSAEIAKPLPNKESRVEKHDPVGETAIRVDDPTQRGAGDVGLERMSGESFVRVRTAEAGTVWTNKEAAQVSEQD